MLIAASVSLLGLAVGCSGPSAMPKPVQGASASSEGVLRQVHSPGKVTDDMHLTSGQCHLTEAADGEPLPDPGCTPGAVDPAVTQATIKTTICKTGWTTTVRPSVADSGRWKRISEADYGDPAGFVGEFDHLVPLELGGANSTSNLWPEPGKIPNSKDRVESRLRSEVCAGKITLIKAQLEIVVNWTTAK